MASAWNRLLLVGACALTLFLLRGSLEAQGSPLQPRKAGWRIWLQPAHLILAAVSGGAAGLLVLRYRRYQLFGVGLLAILLYLAQRRLMQRHRLQRAEKRSLTAELVGVALLTLTAPAAWIAARGTLDAAGVRVWLLNVLFFLGGVLYVKYRVRGLLAHRTFRSARERLSFAWPVLLYHLLLVAFLAGWVVLDLQPAAVMLAFVPGSLRASAWLFQLGRRFAIPRLGWSEILHSLLFAALLIIFALRSTA